MSRAFNTTCYLYIVKTSVGATLIPDIEKNVMYIILDLSFLVTIWMVFYMVHDRPRHSGMRKTMSTILNYNEHRDRERRLNEVEMYVRRVMAPYMTPYYLDKFVTAVRNDKAMGCELSGSLSSADLRHLAWNIGQKLHWPGQKSAMFIKQCFPQAMGYMSVESIVRTLRTCNKSVIELNNSIEWKS